MLWVRAEPPAVITFCSRRLPVTKCNVIYPGYFHCMNPSKTQRKVCVCVCVSIINSWFNGSTNVWNSDSIFLQEELKTAYKSATYGLINTKTYEGVNIKIHTFFPSALDGGGWSHSLLARFTPEEGVLGIHWTEQVWLSPTAGLYIAKRRKSSALSEIEPWFLSCPASGLFTVLAELSSFPSILKYHWMSTNGEKSNLISHSFPLEFLEFVEIVFHFHGA